VVPALIRRFHEARQRGDAEVAIWGTGTPLREFLHVDDLAAACLLLMQRYSDEQIVNVGSGEEVSVAQLAQLIADVVGYRGRLVFDASKPDGTPRKLLDTGMIHALSWQARIPLAQGLMQTHQQFAETPA
jgi:GDP-L-fucose synthase